MALPGLTIGRVAEATALGIETVRYYEREGLLPPPSRTATGYRMYQDADVQRLHFIKRAKGLGFTLREIGELLNLSDDSEAPESAYHTRVEAKLADIEARLAELQRMRDALVELSSSCAADDDAPASECCPILAALQGRDTADYASAH